MVEAAVTLAIIQNMIDYGLIKVVYRHPTDPNLDRLEITEKGLDEKEFQKYLKETTEEGRVLNK